ncbi:MAG: hypothetical protein HQL88_09150 [Magnetococcales bacterium]|nr:hypothetical protein [Magnetococcales bacterium]
MIDRIRLGLLLIFSLALLSACAPAASMRVDVDVYKGPLSKNINLQWGELLGVVIEAEEGFIRHCRNYGLTACSEHESPSAIPSIGCAENSSGSIIKNRTNAPYKNFKMSEHLDKSAERLIHESAENFQKDLHALQSTLLCTDSTDSTDSDEEKAEKALARKKAALVEAGALAVQMKTVATQLAGYFLMDDFPEMHGKISAFSHMTDEYATQIYARTSALSLQELDDVHRTQVPLSILVGDARATDFANLYAWSDPSISEDKRADPVRMFERLYADHYWSNINTVHATGLDKTQIAFVRDELGNWDLKSFASDPSELVNAYRKMALTGITAATDAIAAYMTAGASAAGKDVSKLLTSVNTLMEPNNPQAKFVQNAANTQRLRAQKELETLRDENKDVACDKAEMAGRCKEAIEKAVQILAKYHVALDTLSSKPVTPALPTVLPAVPTALPAVPKP